jgi:phosphotransferase system HPr (HPr) family protein
MKLFKSKSISDSLTVSNPHGIHIRPATNISLLAEEYPETSVTFSLRNRKANGTSINEILALSAGYQDVVSVQIEGPKAKQLFKKMSKLFSDLDQYDGPSPEVSCFDPENRQCGYGRLIDDRLWE